MHLIIYMCVYTHVHIFIFSISDHAKITRLWPLLEIIVDSYFKGMPKREVTTWSESKQKTPQIGTRAFLIDVNVHSILLRSAVS